MKPVRAPRAVLCEARSAPRMTQGEFAAAIQPEARGGAPAADARRWLHTVMKRARDVGLTVEEAEEALRPRPANG